MNNNEDSITQQRNESKSVECPVGKTWSANEPQPCLTSLVEGFLETIVGLLFSIRARSPWLTIREAERYVHAPHGVINKAIKDGELPAYQRSTNTVMLVDVEEVNKWIRDKWRIRYVDGHLRRAR